MLPGSYTVGGLSGGSMTKGRGAVGTLVRIWLPLGTGVSKM